MKDQLLRKIKEHEAIVAIVGLGYVGLPLAVAFAERGFTVVGIDVDPRKVDSLNCGDSYVQDIPSGRLRGILPRFSATTSYAALEQCDAVIICVPTPLNKTRDPDVRFLIAAGESISQYIHPGMLVVLESTTYPGTTEELLLPMFTDPAVLKRLGRESFTVGEDFFLAFSPERIDPGNKQYVVENTPKAVCGGEHAEGRRRGDRGLPGGDGSTVRAGHRADRAGVVYADRGDGEAAGKHLPRGQHRAGQRSGDHVR
jgi:UDP-N-acetyl-D-glucosamine dehydrogenase